MYDEDGIIKAVELAPNGVVRSVYPQASNADALGLGTGRAFSMKSKSTNYRVPPTST